jgi:hypothetical protein
MNPLLTCGISAASIAIVILVVRTIAGLSGMFKTNSFTGKVTSANRDWTTNEVMLSITALSGSGTRTFRAGDPLALEIEMLIVSYRREQQSFVITVEFDPRDGVSMLGYSIMKG